MAQCEEDHFSVYTFRYTEYYQCKLFVDVPGPELHEARDPNVGPIDCDAVLPFGLWLIRKVDAVHEDTG